MLRSKHHVQEVFRPPPGVKKQQALTKNGGARLTAITDHFSTLKSVSAGKQKHCVMSKLSKRLLAVSLVAFAIGFVGVCGGPGVPMVLSVGMPAGAIFLGLFMVARILQTEMAKYDEEEDARLALARRYATAPSNWQPAASSRAPVVATLAALRR
jgi:hypothetical protein